MQLHLLSINIYYVGHRGIVQLLTETRYCARTTITLNVRTVYKGTYELMKLQPVLLQRFNVPLFVYMRLIVTTFNYPKKNY